MRIPTPVPTSLVSTIGSIFKGSNWLVAWRLLALFVGAYLIIWLLAATSGFFGYIIVWILVVFTVGAIITAIARNIWNFEFWSFKL